MSITFQLFHAKAVVFQINSLEGVAVGLCDFVLPVTLSLPLVACAALWTKSLIICTCWLVYALPRSERAIMYKYATHAQSGFQVSITNLLLGVHGFLYSSFPNLFNNASPTAYIIKYQIEGRWRRINHRGLRMCPCLF
jgi:hypothetical protein